MDDYDYYYYSHINYIINIKTTVDLKNDLTPYVILAMLFLLQKIIINVTIL